MSILQRQTKETDIKVEVNPYGTGRFEINTSIGFFNHMLESFTKHSQMDITITCKGDTHVDFHHCVEDVGIALGQALHQEIFPITSIERFGEASIVMDEALVTSTLDISNRAYLYFDLPLDGKVGEFDTELVEEFFRAFCFNLSITLHTYFIRGKNKHHIIEAGFKSLAVALKRALKKTNSGIPSTKGVL